MILFMGQFKFIFMVVEWNVMHIFKEFDQENQTFCAVPETKLATNPPQWSRTGAVRNKWYHPILEGGKAFTTLPSRVAIMPEGQPIRLTHGWVTVLMVYCGAPVALWVVVYVTSYLVQGELILK